MNKIFKPIYIVPISALVLYICLIQTDLFARKYKPYKEKKEILYSTIGCKAGSMSQAEHIKYTKVVEEYIEENYKSIIIINEIFDKKFCGTILRWDKKYYEYQIKIKGIETGYGIIQKMKEFFKLEE